MFRAYEPDQDRLVAVKLFRLDLPPDRVHRLVAELDRLHDADLTHLAIAAPLATGISDVSAFLAQDFVAAESLDIVMREHGAAPPTDAIRVALQIADALDFAAAAGVLHGTLHPRDVLVSPDDARLTGLGVAQALERVGVTAPVRRPYTAPERAVGKPWDRRADVFSLAAIVYEMLWGRRLTGFGGPAVEAQPAVPGGDLGALRALFARALAEQPAERFGTAQEFAEHLRRAFSAMEAQAPTSLGRTRRSLEIDRRPASIEPRLPLDEPDGPQDDTDAEPVAYSDAGERHIADSTEAVWPAEIDEFDISSVLADADTFDERQADPAGESADADFELAPRRGVPSPPEEPEEPEELEDERAAAPVAVPEIAFAPPGAGGGRRPGWLMGVAVTAAFAVGLGVGYQLARAPAEPTPTVLSETPPPAEAAGAARAGSAPGEPSPSVAELPRAEASAPPLPETPRAVASAPERAAAPPRPAAPTPPRLSISTRPAGARVVVEGRDVGVTPVTVSDLAPGRYTVRVTREGYVAQEQRVTVSAGQPVQSLAIPLRPVPAPSAAPRAGASTAPLVVESRPAGARVFVNGKLIGQTPMAIAEMPVGEHAVRLELEGYRGWISPVRVVSGERNRVAASLEP